MNSKQHGPHIKRQPCPTCGSDLDAAMAQDNERTPKSGDASMCYKCAELLEFVIDDDGDLCLIRLTGEKREEAERDETISRVRGLIIEFHKSKAH